MNFEIDQLITAFMLTLFAGLSTGIGSAMAFLTKKTNTKFLAISLGFSAGVMIYVSFIEIFVKANDAMTNYFGEEKGYFLTTVAFFCGMFLIAIIDKIVPSFENPHEMKNIEDMSESKKTKSLYRMGVMSALAIAIHNFPEGLATFTSSLSDPGLGISIAIAIAIHNIPEGIAVSVPIYYATGDRKKAFKLSFLSGLAEPLGAIIGFALISTIFNDAVFGFLFASVAGIMVFISIDELLPSAREYGDHHLSIYGFVAGMIVMAFSLILFK
ncbi:MAG: zinc transporter ZupT [Candidatus Delongbacteria bacterium]|nr:zinc transporter ZupT [Candidatus Delongbacteria bacterium]MBN2836533.1 zinc transporter ZupT [Candidatus Delongbacteria bacterium]